MIDIEEIPPEVWQHSFGPVRPTWARMVEEALAYRPAEIAALVEALDTGEEAVLAWFEEFAKAPIDPVLRAALKEWLFDEEEKSRSRQVPIFHMIRLARYHRRRLGTPPRDWYRERAAEVDVILKKAEGWELMQSLEAHGWHHARLKALEGILPGAVMTAEERGHYLGAGGKLVSATERIIIKDNRLLVRTQKPLRDEDGFLLTDKHGRVIAYRLIPAGDLEGMIDPSALGEYVEIENAVILDGAITKANLPRREEEVARLAAQGLLGVDIAAELGTDPSTVRSQLGVIYGKVSSESASN